MCDFSLEIPHLTYYLKRILDRYPLGGQILKELLQNAEDSGATVIKFFIDYTEYSSEKLIHSDLSKFQGPALLAYNNSQFDESDFEGIRNIEQSRKYDKPLKIGKFGLGFNSVYHLTDLPSVISGHDLVIFDPHERYFSTQNARRGIRFNFKDQAFFGSYFDKFRDQFKPYTNIKFGDEIQINFKDEFKGTLFRFPIRNREAAQVSELCSTFKKIDKIIYEDILDSFFKDLNIILLFLRKIENVEIYEIKNNEQNLIASTSINFNESSENLREIRHKFMERLIDTVKKTDKTMKENAFMYDDLIYNFKLAIETKILDKNSGLFKITNEKYLVSNFVKLKSASNELQNLALRTATFPACGVAYKLNDENDWKVKFESSRYFCFLPMPETIDKSGLPLHINGSFGLRDDRRDFKWLSADSKEDESAKWNELIFNEVLNKVCIQLLNYAKDMINLNDSDFDLSNFYSLIPDLENIGYNWKQKYLKKYLNNLSETDLVLNRCLEWSNINEIYLTNKIDSKINSYLVKNNLDRSSDFKEKIYECFDPRKLSKIPVPKHVLEIFEKYNQIKTLKYLDEMSILNLLRDRTKFSYENLSQYQKVNLLNFIIQSINDLEDLSGIQLIPLKDGKWTCLNSEPIFYFENEQEINIFDNRINRLIFDDEKLNKKSKIQLIDILLNEKCQTILKFNKKFFPGLYQKCLNGSYTVKSLEWCEKIWNYISTNYNDSLNCLESLPLLPYFDQNSNSNILLTLKKSIDTTKYFTIDHENNSILKLANFFENYARFETNSKEIYGCLFLRNLPEQIINNPKINKYICIFNSNNLLDFLLLLDECLKNKNSSLKSLIEQEMNSEFKTILMRELNSIKNVTCQQSLKLLAEKIPIFNALNKPNTFLTASDCSFKRLNPNFDILDLPLMPKKYIIDTRYCENLARILNFQNYPIENIFEESIDYFMQSKDSDSIKILLEWLMMNRFKLTENGKNFETFFYERLADKQIFKDNSSKLKCLREIYDPKDFFVQKFVPKTLHLNDEFTSELFYSCFKRFLSKNIKHDHFENFIQGLNNNKNGFSKEEFYEKCRIIFKFLSNNNQIEFFNLSLFYNWLPNFDFSNQEWSKTKFYKSSELWDHKFQKLIRFTKPFYDQDLIPFNLKEALKINSDKPNLNDVFENLDLIIEMQINKNSENSFLIGDLNEIYDFFQNFMDSSEKAQDQLIAKLKSHFETRAFVFDGKNTFYKPSIFVYESEILDLSPYYINLASNSFCKKFKDLYVNVFQIKEKLDLKLMIDILKQISESKINSSIYILLYDLIEKKYENELINSTNLCKEFILPVLNIDNSYLEFENIHRCVYLVENEVTDKNEFENDLAYKIETLKDKGYRICSHKISNRFLRKLGVSSSTEILMGVQNLNYESFGQFEKLTDRIKQLLDGYKDGISIFKEAIQNADDAGATIVKICYDKRTFQNFRNPLKLLDRELVNCQGPSLVFYNDAVFTDDDFINVTKLGAATKNESKDKVGKFGLGFNTFYNVTDLPSILSRDSLVLFDPNIKFMKNIIKNIAQPGIKLNLNSLKKSDLLNYSDQFKPYENLFGCDIFKEDFFFNGSIIRLPLRNEPSEISSHIYNNDSEIESLLEILINNADSMLLFTQTVKKVEFYVIPSETENADPILFLRFEKSPQLYLENQSQSNFKTADEIFINETSILKASSKRNQVLKSAYVIRNKVCINDQSLSLVSPSFQTKLKEKDHYWLIVSNYNPKYLISDDQVFKYFVPCTGLAVKLNKNLDTFSIDSDTIGKIFCFLPLPIDSNLKFHINAPFYLTKDRLNFYENSRDDKTENNLHKWNEYLLKPLIENLVLLIEYTNNLNQINDPVSLVSIYWPIEMKIKYLKEFENFFYEIICSEENEICVFPTVMDQNSCYSSFNQSVFIDFDFKIQDIQQKALNFLKKFYQNSKCLVNLPSKYLEIVKSKTIDKSKFINVFAFLQMMISNLSLIDRKDYTHLLIFYLNQQCFDQKNRLTESGYLIKNYKCIPTCNNSFKSVHELIDPNSNIHFRKLFNQEDGLFPCDSLCENSESMYNLKQLGITFQYLKNETVIDLANKISNSNLASDKSHKLFENLSEYLIDFFKNSESDQDKKILKNQISKINWIIAKSKPLKWNLPWFTSKNEFRFYKPGELFSDRDEYMIGSIKPLFESRYNFINSDNSNKNEILNIAIEQFRYLKVDYEARGETFSQNYNDEYSNYFKSFYLFLQKNSTEDESIVNNIEIVKERLELFKSKLPINWIYCPENSFKNRFLSVDSFAIDVKNTFEPELLKLPISSEDYKIKNFFMKMGVINSFSIESLRLKLIQLKDKFDLEPLDEEAFGLCNKIISEIIYVDDYRKDSQNLSEIIKSKEFHLPDENKIIRNLNNLCDRKTSNIIIDNHKLYTIHPLFKDVFEKFKIDTKSKIVDLMRTNFVIKYGQKENLVDRIKNILDNYSLKTSFFNELIQNADDAKADRICFILDTRKLDTIFTPDKKFEDLQGPAILCYNNSVFSEKDLQGIISLGIGSKRDDINSIGRFGVGFNSVYHLTDAPQLLSNFQDYVFLDPLCKYYPGLDPTEPGIRVKNANINLQSDIFKDVLEGFLIPGFQLEDSTIFRFPLRQKISDISSFTCDLQNAENIFKDFFEKSVIESCIFVKNIREISYYVINPENKIKEISTVSRKIDEKNLLEKNVFNNNMKKYYGENSFIKIPKNILIYKIEIENLRRKNCKNNFIKKSYLIFEQFGFELNSKDDEEIIKNLDINKKEKFFPFASAAFDMDYFDKDFRERFNIFNFLPLYDDREVVSFKFHVNAYWALQNENRASLFNIGHNQKKFNHEKEKWCTEWNLSLINNMIYPLYKEIIKYFRSNFEYLKIDESLFISKMINLLPDISDYHENLNPYFENFCQKFYTEFKNIEIVPIKDSKKNIKWLRPDELFFSRDFEDYFNKKFQNHSINSKNNQKTIELFDIIKMTNKKISRNNELLDLFKRNAEISLKLVDRTFLIQCFIQYGIKLIDFKIEDTIFKNLDNLSYILNYCYIYEKNEIEEFNDLTDCPLLLKQDMKLTTFKRINSSSAFGIDNRLLKFKTPEKFKNQQNKFLHKDFYLLFEKNDSWFRNINSSDLDVLLPSILPKIFKTNTNTKILITRKYFIENNLNNWLDFAINLIIELVNYEFTKNRDLSKSDILRNLKPIENWAIIPIESTNEHENQNFLMFMPIKFADSIIYYEKQSKNSIHIDEIFKIFESVGIPTLKINQNERNDIDNFLIKIVTQLNINEDLIEFLKNRKSIYDKLFVKPNNRKFLAHFNTNITIHQFRKSKRTIDIFDLASFDSNRDQEIKYFIKSLPIFEDFFNRCEPILNRTVYMVDLNKCSNEIRSFFRQTLFTSNLNESNYLSEFLEFSNKEDCYLIEYSSDYSRLLKYLEIPEIEIEELYFKFFKQVISYPDLKLLKYHVKILKSLGIDRLKKNSELWDLLKQLKFINIGENYHSANELYDSHNFFYSKAFESHLLPKEYQNQEWKPFLVELGIKTKLDLDDGIKIASIIRQKYLNKLIDLTDMDKYCKKLFEEFEKILSQDPENLSLISNIKKIKFIPNTIVTDANSIISKIAHFNDIKEDLVCLEDSFINEHKDFIWLIKPCLPNYCNLKIVNYYETGLINSQLSNELIIKNYFNIIELLSENNFKSFNSFGKTEIDQFIRLILKYFEKFQVISISNDRDMLNDLKQKNIFPVKNEKSQLFKFCKLTQLVKNLNQFEQIDNFFYKLPIEYLNKWDILSELGVNENVSFEMCLNVLNHYHSINKEKLNDDEFENVLIAIKLLFFNDVIDKQNFCLPEMILYFPNSKRVLKKLDSLYYIDKPFLDRLVEKSDQLKSITLFDINELKKLVLNSFGSYSKSEEISKQNSNILESLIFEKMTWTTVFDFLNYFKVYPSASPTKLSNKIVEILKETDKDEEKQIDETLMKKINSKNFIEFLNECLILEDDNLEEIDLKNLIENVIKRIKIIRLKNITTHFVDVDNMKQPFDNTEKSLNITSLKSDCENGIDFIIRKDYEDYFEIDFFLSETIVESIISYTKYQSLKNVLTKQMHRIIFLITKFLRTDEQKYKQIIFNYRENSPNNLKRSLEWRSEIKPKIPKILPNK